MGQFDKRVLQLHNVDAETNVITGCLYNDNLFSAVSGQLSADLFTDNENRKAYQILADIEKEGKEVDITEFVKRFMAVGGDVTRYVASGNTSFEITRQRIDMLRDLDQRRKLYILCTKGLSMATDPATTLVDFNGLLGDLNQTSSDSESEVKTIGQVAQELRQDIEERREGRGEKGIMTGMHIFDSRFGFHGGDLVILAGRTSQGKSTLATTMCRNMALMGTPSVYYSFEMSSKQLTARIMAKDVLLSSSKLLYDKISDGELNSFDTAIERMEDLPIYFDDKNKTSFAKVCTSIRALVRRYGVKVVYIDYLQILANSTSENREQFIGDMARELKKLAVELNICIVALSQLARAKDKQSPEPTLAELRGSGQIEEACDTAILVYRPHVYGIERYKTGELTFGTAQITLAKGRNIGLGQEIVHFNGEYSYFEDIDPNAEPQGLTEEQQKMRISSSGWADSESLPF